MNILWGIMIVFGIISSLFCGNLPELTNSVIASGKEAVTLAFSMCGIVSIWCGMMKIAEKSGMLDSITRFLFPVIHKLFPDIPKNHSAIKYITTNITANIFGLGWAATPAGISAMKSMSDLNRHSKTASKSMCMFMIINMSSVQLITISILAYRAQYGSLSPASIVLPGIIATTISTIIGIIVGKIAERCVFK